MNKPRSIQDVVLFLMKISLIQILFMSMFASLVCAADTSGQNALDRKISLNVSNQKLTSVLSEIKKQALVTFTYRPEIIDDDKKISLQVDSAQLGDVLKQIFGDGIRFVVLDNDIILKPADVRNLQSETTIEAGDLLTQTITGQVSEEDGQPLPGVNVLEKGTNNGTSTDAAGKYSISLTKENGTLVFSFIGYQTKEVLVNQLTLINISLAPDVTSLKEIVVVGYGTQQRRKITGSVSSVKGETINQLPVTSANALLQGRAAGVQVVQSAGNPGSAVSVRIRGASSLIGDNAPLYVIDGVPVIGNNGGTDPNNNALGVDGGGIITSALSDINPNDIESMEVLKDASAAAIYGARAANGVVLITTKRGKSGKSTINFNGYTGVQQVWNKLDVLNGSQYVELMRDQVANAKVFGTAVPSDTTSYLWQDTGVNEDWQDAIFRDALISKYDLSIGGGSDKTQYFLSAGYFLQDGIVIGSSYKRFNGRVNIDHQASKKLKIGNSLTVSRAVTDRIFNDYNEFSVLGIALRKNPNVPVYSEPGAYSVDAGSGNIRNPVRIADQTTFDNYQNRFIGNVYAEYELLSKLVFKTSFSADYLLTSDDLFRPSAISANGNGSNFATAASSGSTTSSEGLTWVNENSLSYTHTLNEKHNISGLAVFSHQVGRRKSFNAVGNTSASDNITAFAFSAGIGANTLYTQYGLRSYTARVNYDYEGKYLLSATLRVDGSSRFGPGKKYGTFPSFSAGWRISDEAFMQNLSNVINDLKIRASYGLTGNQEGIPNYDWQGTYNSGANYLSSLPGIASNINAIRNEDLSWESTAQTNIGIDLSMLNGRINIIADAYQKDTYDILFFKIPPRSTGYNRTTINSGKVQNKGVEFMLATKNLVGDLQWNTEFNISYNMNKVIELPASQSGTNTDFVEGSPGINGNTGVNYIYRVGEPVGSFYAIKALGVDPATGNMIYEDFTPDGRIDQLDRQVVGNAQPLHTGGINNTFSYKGIDLTVFLQWSYGNDMYNQTKALLERMNTNFNASTEVLRRWKQEGDVTDIPKAIWGDPVLENGQQNGFASSRYIEDGSYLRIKTATIGYNFPTALISKISLSKARLYVSAQNLFTFTNYSGFDPEVQNQNNKNSALGTDYATYPQARTLLVGFNLGF